MASGEHYKAIPRTHEKSITLVDTPYTLPLGYNQVKVDTTGGNVRVNLPDTNYPIDVIKTSSDSYIVTVWVGGTQIGEVAGELSKITIESGNVTKDEPWYPYDYIVSIAGVSGNGGEVVAKNHYGQCLSSTWRGVAGTISDVNVIQAIATIGGRICLRGSFTKPAPNCASIVPAQNSEIFGFGKDITNLNLIKLNLLNTNQTVHDLSFSGACESNIYDICARSNNISIRNTYHNQTTGGIYCRSDPGVPIIKDHVIESVVIYRPTASGIMIYGDGFPVFQNIVLRNCDVYDAGVYNNSMEYAVGIDLCEQHDTVVNNILASHCRVFGAWESGFHTEIAPTINGLRIENCYVENAGQKPAAAIGAGFIAPPGDGELTTLDNCVTKNCKYGYYIRNLTGLSGAGTKLSNCVDDGSVTAFHVLDNLGPIYINDCISRNAALLGLHCFGSSNIHVKNFGLINPVGDADGLGAILSTGGRVVSDSDFDIHAVGDAASADTLVYGGYLSNCCISGMFNHAKGGNSCGLYVGNPSNVIIDGVIVSVNGLYGIRTGGTIVNTRIQNITLQSNSAYVLTNGIYSSTTKPTVNRRSVKNMGTITNLFTEVNFDDSNSGSSTGTGSEQTIAHGLAAIPTGCKAWITYLVGTRYVTEMIPFDATNVYPTVDNGVAYTWRIE